MPVLETKGALSAQGYGLTTSRPAANYIEDVFSTWLYTGNGGTQAIPNGMRLNSGATSPGWLTTISSNTAGASIAVANSGNVYVGGTNAGAPYIAKFNSDGTMLWQVQRDTNRSPPVWVVLDNSENVYVNFNLGFLGGVDVAKYDTNGNLQWQRRLGSGDNSVREFKIAVSPAGAVYVAGQADGGSGVGFHVASYDTNGNFQWQTNVRAGTGESFATDVAFNPDGDLVVVGSSVTFDGSSFVGGIQILKFRPNGTVRWQRAIPTGAFGFSVNARIGVNGNNGDIYVSGNNAADQVTLIRYTSDGNFQWQRRLFSGGGAAGAITSGAIRVMPVPSGNIYLTLNSTSNPAFIYTAKYDAFGSLVWQRQFSAVGTAFTNNSSSSELDSFENVYVANSVGSRIFAAKVPGNGSGMGIYAPSPVTIVYQPAYFTEQISSLTPITTTATPATLNLGQSTPSIAASVASQTTVLTPLIEEPLTPTSTAGLVWMKGRGGATAHALYDTARGATFEISSNSTGAQLTESTGLTGFLSNGFSIGSLLRTNTNAATYASWTFREQPKFFDIVTYTGNGANRTIAHSLGSVPGCIMVKRLDASADWQVYHREVGPSRYMVLNSAAANVVDATRWNNTEPTATEFSLGTDATVNASGGTYVAYLFAHDAGGFGASGADNVISCGRYTGNGSATGPVVTLGYEPQWLLIKRSSFGTGDWNLIDNMRGFVVGGTDAVLNPNLSNAESAGTFVTPTATGFQLNTTDTGYNASGSLYIYIAIRRGPMRTPTSGTSVFAPVLWTTPSSPSPVNLGFPADASLRLRRGSFNDPWFISRLTGGGVLITSNTDAEATNRVYQNWDNQQGYWDNAQVTGGQPQVIEGFRRAPGFFDVVCYTGTGVARTVNHNLGVAPELMIVKRRNASEMWPVYAAPLGATKYLILNTQDRDTVDNIWNNTSPTSSVFSVLTYDAVNASGSTYVAYLFASCPGVSRVGSYTGTGATQTINCGFSAGARFVLIKRTDSAGNWFVWDSARGIVAGNDPYLLLNSTAAEVTTTDWVDTAASGFELSNAAGNLANTNGASYIFLSIA